MKVTGVAFLGVRTAQVAQLSQLFAGVLGMETFAETPDFVGLRTSGGDVVEIFPAEDATHAAFDSGPVAGFAVEDLASAYEELDASGLVTMLSGIEHGSKGSSWFHFRGPDGNVYELLADTGGD